MRERVNRMPYSYNNTLTLALSLARERRCIVVLAFDREREFVE